MRKRVQPSLRSRCRARSWPLAIGHLRGAWPTRRISRRSRRAAISRPPPIALPATPIPNGGKPFAGGRPIETPFGNITSPNITPDAETGIGAWTDEQFDNAVRNGMRPDGSRLYPAMPYPSYTKMSHDDVVAIRAYLKTVEPVRHPVDCQHAAVSVQHPRLDAGVGLRFISAGRVQARSAEAGGLESRRVSGRRAGPLHRLPYAEDRFWAATRAASYLRGSYLQGWFAPDITNDERAGSASGRPTISWPISRPAITASPPRPGRWRKRSRTRRRKLKDEDLAAMAAYLKSLPVRQDSPAPLKADDPVMVAGQAIYRDQCSACHRSTARACRSCFRRSRNRSGGPLRAIPPTLIRIVLRGARSVATTAGADRARHAVVRVAAQ